MVVLCSALLATFDRLLLAEFMIAADEFVYDAFDSTGISAACDSCCLNHSA